MIVGYLPSILPFATQICEDAEAVARRCSVKNVPLKVSQNSQENICVSVSFLNFIEKETLTQVISSEFCKNLKNTFFTEHLRWLLLKMDPMVNPFHPSLAFHIETSHLICTARLKYCGLCFANIVLYYLSFSSIKESLR